MRVLWLSVIGELEVNPEERELRFISSHLLDLLLREIHVCNSSSVKHVDGDGKEVNHGVDVAPDRAVGHLEEGVLHDELGLSEELLQLSLLVRLSVHLVEVEHGGGADALGSGVLLVTLLGEAGLDDLLDFVDPGLFEEVGGLRDGRSLDLVELVNFHSLGHVGVEHVFNCHFVALFADLLLSLDDFVFDLEGAAAVLAELFGEVVGRDRDHSEERGGFSLWLLGEVELSGDQVGSLGRQMLVEDDLVHGLRKVDVDFVEESGSV